MVDKVGFMVPVDLPIIRQHIVPGTTIISDLWAITSDEIENSSFSEALPDIIFLLCQMKSAI